MLYSQLYDFQKEIIDKYSSRHRLGLFLDMGLGKTITSLALCEHNNINKILVISIKSKSTEDIKISGSFDMYLFKEGFKVWKKNPKTNNINYISDSYEKEAMVINYHSLLTKNKELPPYLKDFIDNCKKEKFAIIFDESHKLKNSGSQTSKQASKLITYTQLNTDLYLYLLTGTPFTQGFIDLYNQLKFLGLNMTKGDFVRIFGIRGEVPGLYEWQQPIVGYKNIKELFELVNKYAITELTENNIKLPQQVFTDIVCKKTKEFSYLISQYLKTATLKKIYKDRNLKWNLPSKYENLPNPFFRNFGFPDDKYRADTAGTYWLRARQLSIGFQGNADEYDFYNYERLEKLREFLEDNRENYIIFYNYTPELKVIFDLCYELNYLIDVYCGDIKELTYYNNYDQMTEEERFNAQKRVLIVNYASGKEGKNWQLYNRTIFFSLPLYGEYAQALKRNHRIGQLNTVYYYRFYQDNFLDRGMLKALEFKQDYNEKMFNYDSSQGDIDDWEDIKD